MMEVISSRCLSHLNMESVELSHDDLFANMIELSLQNLFDLLPKLNQKGILEFYCKVLISYLASDQIELEKICYEMQQYVSDNDTQENQVILKLSQIRLKIRNLSLSFEMVNDFLQQDFLNFNGVLRGEIYFIIARSFEVLTQFKLAKEFYFKSFQLFYENGVQKKAAKSYFNSLTNESRLAPELNYIENYKKMIHLASQAREFSIISVGLMNISRELEAMGALNLALKFAGRSLLFIKNDVGSLHYYLALLNRAHIYLTLNNIPKARLDLDGARVSEHIEIKYTLEYLDLYISNNPNFNSSQINYEKLTDCWKMRFHSFFHKAFQSNPKLSFDEQKLIEILFRKSRSRKRLISMLWGDNEDAESLKMRLKGLIHRLRIKKSYIIEFKSDHYCLTPKSWIYFKNSRNF